MPVNIGQKAYVVVAQHDSGTITVRDVYLNFEAATHATTLMGGRVSGHVITVPLVTLDVDLKTLDGYQQKAGETAHWHENNANGGMPPLAYCALAMGGETGELQEKIKKLYRDDNGVLSDERRHAILTEAGDVLWYLSQLAALVGAPLSQVAALNIQKLEDRKARGVLAGSGDTR